MGDRASGPHRNFRSVSPLLAGSERTLHAVKLMGWPGGAQSVPDDQRFWEQ